MGVEGLDFNVLARSRFLAFEALRFCSLVLLWYHEQQVYKFVFGIQQPMYVALAPAVAVEDDVPLVNVTGRNWKELAMSTVRHTFTVDYMTLVSASCLDGVDMDNIECVPDCVHTGGDRMVSDADQMALKTFLERLPPLVARRSGQTTKTTEGTSDLLTEFPWLEKYLAKEHTDDVHTAAGASTRTGTKCETDGPSLGDDEIERLFAEFEQLQADMTPLVIAEEGDNFKVSVISGIADLKTKGHDTSSFFRERQRSGSQRLL